MVLTIDQEPEQPRISDALKYCNSVRLFINSFPRLELVDTGSEVTLISKELYDKIKLGRPNFVKKRSNVARFITANKSSLTVYCKLDVEFRINGLVIPFCVNVVDGLSNHCILGMDI